MGEIILTIKDGASYREPNQMSQIIKILNLCRHFVLKCAHIRTVYFQQCYLGSSFYDYQRAYFAKPIHAPPSLLFAGPNRFLE